VILCKVKVVKTKTNKIRYYNIGSSSKLLVLLICDLRKFNELLMTLFYF